MKSSLMIGLLLIALGVAGLVYKSFSYTTEETVVQLGSLKATAEVENQVPVPTILGVIAIVAGVVVIAIGSKK
ncbi:MAG: hypothetical protein U1E13_11905 [Methylophilaceae bacterium]|jgi:uncharacterized membrane protein|nr:hypothetical protein [Methylophilaceae bacterium]